MGAFISKQPNGKYCRFSTVVDSVTDYNMTEEDYINLCVERAIEEAKDVLKNYTRPFQWVIDSFHPNNDSCEEFIEKLKEMGCDEHYTSQIKSEDYADE